MGGFSAEGEIFVTVVARALGSGLGGRVESAAKHGGARGVRGTRPRSLSSRAERLSGFRLAGYYFCMDDWWLLR